jgi:hypothetical protein
MLLFSAFLFTINVGAGAMGIDYSGPDAKTTGRLGTPQVNHTLKSCLWVNYFELPRIGVYSLSGLRARMSGIIEAVQGWWS